MRDDAGHSSKTSETNEMAYIGRGLGHIKTNTEYQFTASDGQTTFGPVDYTIGFVSVYKNGRRIKTFSATTGTNVVLTTPCAAGDEVLIVAQSSSTILGSYTKSESDLRYQGKDETFYPVASAATVDLSILPAGVRCIELTGTEVITAFTVPSGRRFLVRFAGACTLSNNAAIVTNRSYKIKAAVADSCEIRATAANTVEILRYIPGRPNSGKSWQNMTTSRQIGQEYPNDTGDVIDLSITVSGGSINTYLDINGVQVANVEASPGCFQLPLNPGDIVRVRGGTLTSWWENRRT